MTAVYALREEIAKIGYSTIESDYAFSDVFAPSGADRIVPLAAFTHTPPSYRNAALAVVEAKGRDASDVVTDYRALGAPLLFVIEDQQVTVWQVHPVERPTIHRQTTLDQLGSLFTANREIWNPQRIHSAKSFGFLNKSYQLDFVDIGLLPAIEGEIHKKLDRLLNETLAETVRLRVIRHGERVDQRLTFRTVFRLLAAKILQDKGHELAASWNATDIDSVLKSISTHYTLPALPGEDSSFKGTVFDSAWSKLRSGINFRNISSDDLAFVYENTLVTEETRELFGVHSTPRPVAEYVVSRLQLKSNDIFQMSVYEPFAGAGVFMVAALRFLRDLLPVEMTASERHGFLVKRISGDEIESFATEVAMLSLILADYPNENGWGVRAIDLFQDLTLAKRARGATVVLCNPPFELFNPAERRRYPQALARSPRKAFAALAAVLDAKPSALGFVLPESFIDGPNYKAQRDRIESLYKDIEIVALPDRVFKASGIRSSLLIAQKPRAQDEVDTTIKSTVVSVRDRDRFLTSGEVSETRCKVRPFRYAPGRLWIDELDELWETLATLPRFKTIADVHRGIEWQDSQSDATRSEPKKGFLPGIHSSDAVHAFAHDRPIYLDCRTDRLRGGAFGLPWKKPKILANAARISRGPWCFAAAIDRDGLVASQQLFGIWPKFGISLEATCALLNGPLAVAYLASHSPPDRLRVEAVNSVPIPNGLSSGIDELVKRYIAIIRERPTLISATYVERANRALYEIDATVLEAYDLSPRLERRLLEYFRDERRPTLHDWTRWFPPDFQAYLPLHRYLSDELKTAASGWVLKVFKPLPEQEAASLREYLD
jgi:type I restriction-modification system DNA methylase subunit